MSSARKSGPDFEQSLKRLEQIIDELEHGNVTLEDSLRMFEEGISLTKACMQRLQEAELKVKTLSKDLDGGFSLTDSEETK